MPYGKAPSASSTHRHDEPESELGSSQGWCQWFEYYTSSPFASREKSRIGVNWLRGCTSSFYLCHVTFVAPRLAFHAWALPFFKALTPDWLGYEQIQLEFILLLEVFELLLLFVQPHCSLRLSSSSFPSSRYHDWHISNYGWFKMLTVNFFLKVASSARSRIHPCMYASTSSEIDGSTKLVTQVYDGPWRLRRLLWSCSFKRRTKSNPSNCLFDFSFFISWFSLFF